PLISAIEAIAKFIRKNSVVIIESTINPGTCEEILVPLIEDATNLHIGDDVTLAHCPERINPADPKWNIYNIARNVGSVPNEEAHKIAEFYGSFLDAEIHPMSSIKVAESTKIIENTFRDINIAYVNELAQSFDAMGIDLYETIQGASNKPFGFMPHWPGAGVGGHCIAVDPYYLIKRAEKSGFDHKFLKRARQINNYMPKYAVERLADALIKREKSIDTTTVGVLGVSYKPNVSDTRESPALEIITHLRDSGANVEIFDPLVPEYSTKETLEELLQGVDAILLATAHPQIIEKLTPKILKKHKIEVVLDGRNVLDKKSIESEGILYRGIGR
ncbi:nucleotide sugar dehydrogenase, partial [Candidatus Dojkabacteria bacterium]|nr:nucleotide sugar dehydrogenase [Candidatus Dojkabacteria bacterium]